MKADKPKSKKQQLLDIVIELKKRIGLFQNPKFPFKTATHKNLLHFIEQYRILGAYKRYHGLDTAKKWQSMVQKLRKGDETKLPVTNDTLKLMKAKELSQFMVKFLKDLDIEHKFVKFPPKKLEKHIIQHKYNEILHNKPLHAPTEKDPDTLKQEKLGAKDKTLDKSDPKEVKKSKINTFIPRGGTSSASRLPKAQPNQLFQEKMRLEVEKLRHEMVLRKEKDRQELQNIVNNQTEIAKQSQLELQERISRLNESILSREQQGDIRGAVFPLKKGSAVTRAVLDDEKISAELQKFRLDNQGAIEKARLDMEEVIAGVQEQIKHVDSDAKQREEIRQTQLETERIAADRKNTELRLDKLSAEVRLEIKEQSINFEKDLSRIEQQDKQDTAEFRNTMNRQTEQSALIKQRLEASIDGMRRDNTRIVEQMTQNFQRDSKINEAQTKALESSLKSFLAENENNLQKTLVEIANDVRLSKAGTQEHQAAVQNINAANERFVKQLMESVSREKGITVEKTDYLKSQLDFLKTQHEQTLQQISAERDSMRENNKLLAERVTKSLEVDRNVDEIVTKRLDAAIQLMTTQSKAQFANVHLYLENQNKSMQSRLDGITKESSYQLINENMKYAADIVRMDFERKKHEQGRATVEFENKMKNLEVDLQTKVRKMFLEQQLGALSVQSGKIANHERQQEARAKIKQLRGDIQKDERAEHFEEQLERVNKLSHAVDLMDVDIGIQPVQTDLLKKVEAYHTDPRSERPSLQEMKLYYTGMGAVEELKLKFNELKAANAKLTQPIPEADPVFKLGKLREEQHATKVAEQEILKKHLSTQKDIALGKEKEPEKGSAMDTALDLGAEMPSITVLDPKEMDISGIATQDVKGLPTELQLASPKKAYAVQTMGDPSATAEEKKEAAQVLQDIPAYDMDAPNVSQLGAKPVHEASIEHRAAQRAEKFKPLFGGDLEKAKAWQLQPSIMTLSHGEAIGRAFMEQARKWSIDTHMQNKQIHQVRSWTTNPWLSFPQLGERYTNMVEGIQEDPNSSFLKELKQLLLKGDKLRGVGQGKTEFSTLRTVARPGEETIGQKRTAYGQVAPVKKVKEAMSPEIPKIEPKDIQTYRMYGKTQYEDLVRLVRAAETTKFTGHDHQLAKIQSALESYPLDHEYMSHIIKILVLTDQQWEDLFSVSTFTGETQKKILKHNKNIFDQVTMAGGLAEIEPKHKALRSLKKNINLNHTDVAEVLENLGKVSKKSLLRAGKLYNKVKKQETGHETVIRVRKHILSLQNAPTQPRKTIFRSKLKRF